MSRCITYQSGGFTNYGISYRKYSQEELEERKTMCTMEEVFVDKLWEDSING